MATDFLDVVARPDADTSAAVLLSGLFEQLHGQFVSRSLSTVGVSFPDAEPAVGLGERLRLHGPTETLRSIGEMPWLRRASDYYQVRAPRSVPPDHAFRVVRRLQPGLSAAKVRRLVARGSATEKEAEVLLARTPTLDAPYVRITSKSSGQRFRLFFEQVPAEERDGANEFNAYGFGVAVPWF